MDILLWLLPAALVTGAAALWASWAGRERPERERTEADVDRLGAALARPMPTSAGARRPRQRERSTGVAVRRSSGPASRRSA